MPTINTQLLQLEEMWAAGKTNDYCVQAAKISKELVTRQENNEAIHAAGILLKSLGEKEFAVKGSGIGFLPQAEALSLDIASCDQEGGPERRTNDTLLAQFLGSIRSERIKGFEPQMTFMNVMPVGPAREVLIAGMDPNGISDPVTKSNYLRAIQENEEREITNQRQDLLERIDRRVSGPIVRHMIATIQQGGMSVEVVNKLMDSAKLNDEERRAVKDAIDAAVKVLQN